MAFENPYVILHGKYKGCKRLSIDNSTATLHDLITPASGKKIRIMRAVLTIEGDTTTATIHEEDDASNYMYGPVEVLASTNGAIIQLDQADGLQTITADKKLQLTLTNTQPISGTIIYVDA